MVRFRKKMGSVRRFILNPERQSRYETFEAQQNAAAAPAPTPSAPQTPSGPSTVATTNAPPPAMSRIDRLRAALDSGAQQKRPDQGLAKDWANALDRRRKLRRAPEWTMCLPRFFSALPALEGVCVCVCVSVQCHRRSSGSADGCGAKCMLV